MHNQSTQRPRKQPKPLTKGRYAALCLRPMQALRKPTETIVLYDGLEARKSQVDLQWRVWGAYRGVQTVAGVSTSLAAAAEEARSRLKALKKPKRRKITS